MTSKELAYKLYNLELGEVFGYYERVPGGWIVNSTVFVPFDNEFMEIAGKPSKEKIILTCPKCGSVEEYYALETYQVQEYKCYRCRKVFKYDYYEIKSKK
ncbi:MAG: transposase [Candidatus Pacearchaeota archaeon]